MKDWFAFLTRPLDWLDLLNAIVALGAWIAVIILMRWLW